MGELKLFLAGDVMTGRGIDQILAHPCDPLLHEQFMNSARGYVALAEQANGPIARGVDSAYIWGDALDELNRANPDARIVNLETAVTCSDNWQPKGINYRMSPANVECLSAAALDCCTLANNHTLDWGETGLIETLATLRHAGIDYAGAGRDRNEAESPALISVASGARVVVFSFAAGSSGVAQDWATNEHKPGVDFLADLSDRSAVCIANRVGVIKRRGDLVVASLHWGGNWGYEIAAAEVNFAHRLIEYAGVDVVHGHSSHHAKAMEVYREKLIIYGCGDLINDYEGIAGHEEFRSDLGLMYFATFEARSGRLLQLQLTPVHRKRMRLQHAHETDARWLSASLTREGERFGNSIEFVAEHRLELRWRQGTDSRIPAV